MLTANCHYLAVRGQVRFTPHRHFTENERFGLEINLGYE